MMQEHNTNTHTHTHMCIWIFFYLHCSLLQLRHQPLVVIWQHQLYHSGQPSWVKSNYSDENIIIKKNTILDIIINIILCNITLKCIISISNHTINHIKSSNIIKWLTVIQTKWEREREREIERITNRNTNRLRECRNKKEN